MSELIHTIREKSQELLAAKRVDGILCLVRDRFDVVQPRLIFRAEEIGSIVGWLAGEDSGFTTGADFSCNGGLHMG